MIQIAGGQVFTPVGLIEADVWVDGDTVLAVGGKGRLGADQVIDAGGMLVGPGLVDLHTHLREPGQTWKEDIASGSRAAAAGGFTAVVAMPNTDPPTDRADRVEAMVAMASRSELVDVVVAGCLTMDRAGRSAADLLGMYELGVRLFTDDGDSVGDSDVLQEVMTILARLDGAVLAQHAEDAALSGGGHLHESDTSRRAGLDAIPSSAEWVVVARDLALAADTGCHYHAQHLSSAKSIELIEQARSDGVRVTAEVTPHHLVFDESHLEGLDTNLKMYPPLRSAEDRQALRDALKVGTIDVVATDHAPHTIEEKAVAFADAPRGVIGLETAASVVWEVAPDRFFEVLSVNPADIAGLARHGIAIEPGSPANLVVFDPNRNWTPATSSSKSANSPFWGRPLRGRPVCTFLEGRITYLLEGEQ